MKVLVTGVAGFIGFHVVKRLLDSGIEVWGIDNINDYYDVDLKYARLKKLGVLRSNVKSTSWVESPKNSNFNFMKVDISNRTEMEFTFNSLVFDYVIHLAAQPGVRYSLENPHTYVDTNVVGFLNVLEGCRSMPTCKLIYASSSSIYGENKKIPFSEEDRVDNPVSLYAATKKSNELMAHVYSHLYGFETVGLRFFTVYGPWGRPDMAPMLFANAAAQGKVVKIFNHGNQSRDFTFIDDIVDGIILLLNSKVAIKNKSDIFNIGNGTPVALMDFVNALEESFGTKIIKEFVEAQPGDVSRTYADTSKIKALTGYQPKVSVKEGVDQFVKWFKSDYLSKDYIQ